MDRTSETGVLPFQEERDRRVQWRLSVVNEASVRVGTTLDIARTAQELADLATEVATWDADADLAEVARVRAGVSEQLTTRGLEELDFTTELVVSDPDQRHPLRSASHPAASHPRSHPHVRGRGCRQHDSAPLEVLRVVGGPRSPRPVGPRADMAVGGWWMRSRR
ncbi:hypothetical protein ACFRAO_36510 [Streptomyces sp. NPDC056656]|uniref:hypothetical protein n=1 Tax=Streptomyces sp. NPDC056656 TaxID=3345895 RepID=UPI00369D9970